MRKAAPILILLIGILALVINFFPGLRLPDSDATDGAWRPVETKLGLDLKGGLRVEYQAAGKAQLFERLKSYVEGGTGTPSYAETALRLDLSESSVRSAIFRLRRRYHELVRAEVGQTVADANELDEELRHLRAVFSESGATL